MSSFLFSSYLLHFNCKFVALKTKKILSTNHHYGNPSTRFSVEPQQLEASKNKHRKGKRLNKN